jgi:hypothetical protein
MTPYETAIIILASATLLLLAVTSFVVIGAAYWVSSQSAKLWKMVDDSRRSENQANDKLVALLMAEIPPVEPIQRRYTDGGGDEGKPGADSAGGIPTDAEFARAFGVETPDDAPIAAQYESGNPRIPGFGFANGRHQ